VKFSKKGGIPKGFEEVRGEGEKQGGGGVIYV